MTVFFTKMYACGGDFLLLDGLCGAPKEPEALARRLLRRRGSVGADALVLVLPGKEGADFSLRFFLPDGSEAARCRGGTLCAAAYLWERREAAVPCLKLCTRGGVLPVYLKSCGRAALTACIGEGREAQCCAVRTVFCGRAELPDGKDLRYGRW